VLTTSRPKNLACYETFHKALDSARSLDTAYAMTWACETMGDMRGGYGILVGGGPRERYHLEDLGVDGRITFKWIFFNCTVIK